MEATIKQTATGTDRFGVETGGAGTGAAQFNFVEIAGVRAPPSLLTPNSPKCIVPHGPLFAGISRRGG